MYCPNIVIIIYFFKWTQYLKKILNRVLCSMTDSIFFQEAKLLAVRKNMTIQGVCIGDANASFGESHARSETRHENLSHGSSKVKSRNRTVSQQNAGERIADISSSNISPAIVKSRYFPLTRSLQFRFIRLIGSSFSIRVKYNNIPIKYNVKLIIYTMIYKFENACNFLTFRKII